MSISTNRLTLALVINPIAGVGGALALKGSDAIKSKSQALALGGELKANQRTLTALEQLNPYKEKFTLITASGDMGESLCQQLGFEYKVVYQASSEDTTEQDTINAINEFKQHNVDLVVFAGGDGTARNVCQAVDDETLVLGIPAGCKIHSGVYAITPIAAGKIIEQLLTGELLSVKDADVMDIDEQQFQQGVVRAKRYGELTIPAQLQYMQSVKMGGKESDELVLADIAAEVIESIDDDTDVIMGSGSTVAFIMEEMGIDNTLLGVDLIRDQELKLTDATAKQLLDSVDFANCKLVITLIGGQGHLFGRGNQQLSPELIKKVGRDNIIVVATKSKLNALNGKPLIADTGDAELDKALSGPIKVITGYHDQVLYPIGFSD